MKAKCQVDRIRAAWGLALASLALVAACSAVPDYTYFTMAYTLLPADKDGAGPLAESLRIRDLEIAPAYDKDKMVYRFSPYQFQYYNYMLWAVKPNKMVSELIVRHLENAGLFDVVTRDYGESRPEYELTGVLEAIEELDSGDEWFAHLAFSLRMTRFRDDQVVWTHRGDVRKRVYNKSPVYVVKALSELMESEMNNVCGRLREFLKDRPRPPEDQP
jgi:ABC-type uncharacterized transport system auxiliary subunit